MCESWIGTILIVIFFVAAVAFGVLWVNTRSTTPTGESNGTTPERDRDPNDIL